MRCFVIGLSVLVLLGGCDVSNLASSSPAIQGAEAVQGDDTSNADAPTVPKTARTAEAFDITTLAERAAAVQTNPQTSTFLGETIASLGNPADTGIWLLTPLVDTVQAGRVQYGDSSVVLELRPIRGEPTGASQLSLSAMRLLQAPLTELVRVNVFAN
ncbi:hypothetical protein [Nereida sp. NH-UV-3]|uniref:hypothetical protein n=1 Tax=Nereida TaxID=282198 RepID=UPI0036F39D90